MARALKYSCLAIALFGLACVVLGVYGLRSCAAGPDPNAVLTLQSKANNFTPSYYVHAVFTSHDFVDGTATLEMTGLNSGDHVVGIVCTPRLWTFLKANGGKIHISQETRDGSFQPLLLGVGEDGSSWCDAIQNCHYLGVFFSPDQNSARLRISLPPEVFATDSGGFLIVVIRSPEETEAPF